MSSLNDDVLPQAAAQSSGSQQSNKSSRGPRPRLFLKDRCQADQCATSDLRKLKFYNRRNHICLQHQKIEQFSRRGQTVRFCQRCAIAHSLEEFDGNKRSCREKLEKFNSRRRKNTATASKNNNHNLVAVNQSPSTSSIPSGEFSGLSSEIHDLDSIDLGFDLEDLLPVQEDLNLDLLFAEAAAAPASTNPAAEPAVQAAHVAVANSTNGNERVCCTTMDAECICCQSSEQQHEQQHDDDGANDVVSSSSGADASASNDDDDAATPSSSPAATPTPTADCDDSDACLPGSSDIDLNLTLTLNQEEGEEAVAGPSTPTAKIEAAAAAAKLEAEFAALQATDAAMYAMIVHQQMMQARLLLTTTANALLLQRARSGSLSSGFSRKESFGEISPMVM